jgi:hypothetical protein
MDRQSIAADIRKNYGNFLNISKVTKALGFKDTRAALRFLEGVPSVNMGKERKYMAIDIAKRIEERMEL